MAKDVEAVEVKTICIKFGGKEIECTPTEARKLLKALAELFGEEITKVIHEHHHDWYRYYQPYYPRPYYWHQTWMGGAGSLGDVTSSKGIGHANFQASMSTDQKMLTMQVE